MACSNCDHHEEAVMDDGPVYQCRRYPPVMFVLQGEVTETWPQVDADDWCGEWKSMDRE
jgi:hypothetical protein